MQSIQNYSMANTYTYLEGNQNNNAHNAQRNVVLAARQATGTMTVYCKVSSSINILVLRDVGEHSHRLVVEILSVLSVRQSKQLLLKASNVSEGQHKQTHTQS